MRSLRDSEVPGGALSWRRDATSSPNFIERSGGRAPHTGSVGTWTGYGRGTRPTEVALKASPNLHLRALRSFCGAKRSPSSLCTGPLQMPARVLSLYHAASLEMVSRGPGLDTRLRRLPHQAGWCDALAHMRCTSFRAAARTRAFLALFAKNGGLVAGAGFEPAIARL